MGRGQGRTSALRSSSRLLSGEWRQLVEHRAQEARIAAIRSRWGTARKIEQCREAPQNATWIHPVHRRVPVGERLGERRVKLEMPSSAAGVSFALQSKLLR
ncbi:MAG: hypothetical protein K0Q46_6697 [Rhodococcus erythropolis]|nr:hypothetical protein [Rhodococcus erythropolis]